MTRLRRLLTLSLVAVLLASVAMTTVPVSALAAPPAAPAAQAYDASGTYLSSVYPAASAPGLVMLMSLFPNNNAEVVSYYFSNPPVIEQGTWQSGDAGVVVTLTGSTDRTYDEPITETFTLQDGDLSSRGFVFHKLDTIAPEQMEAASDAANAEATAEPSAEATAEATEEATAEATEEPTAEATADATEEAAATPEPSAEAAAPAADAAAFEVFASDVYPAADASGMVMLMALFPNNNMEQLSVYVGKDAILEVGTWAAGADGAVDTTLTGQLDQEYETPVTATYTRDGDTLTDGVFTFYKLQIITPADIEAMMNPAGTYVSKLYPAADAPGMLTVLSLFANNNVEQVTIYIGKDAVMEQGTWAESEDGSGAITVTIDRSGDTTYDAPNVTDYTRDGDTLRDGVFELTRIAEVTPAEMDAATSDAASSDTATSDTATSDASTGETTPMAVYQSDTLPAADSPGRVITLSLYEEGSKAEMTTDFLNDAPLIVETGTWESSETGKLTVTLTHAEDQGEYATPIVIGFEDVDGTLTAVDYDQSLFGSEGLTLNAVE